MTCTHKAEVLACSHVGEGNAEIEVLLVADNLHVDYALCLECSVVADPETLDFVSLCRQCANRMDVPAVMPTPGKWQVGALDAN